MTELVLRLVFSLAVVLGMLVLLARLGARRFRGGSGAVITVLHRQALSRGSAVAVVAVGSRVLVVGTTDHQVQLLTELDPAELDPAGLNPAELNRAEFQLAEVEVADRDADAGRIAPAAPTGATADPTPPAPASAQPGLPTQPAHPSLPGSARPAASVNPVAPASPATQAARAARVGDGALADALAGSVLSAHTWRQAITGATRRERDAS